MIRLTVRRSGPPSSPLSTSTPGPIARHAPSITAWRGCLTAIAVSALAPGSSLEDRSAVEHLLAEKLGSVAGALSEPSGMPDALLLTVLAVIGVGIAATLLLSRPVASPKADVAPDVGIGTVRQITDVITIEVESVTGLRFTGGCAMTRRLDAASRGRAAGRFDPAAREHLSLADDMLAVRAVFDQMLVDKGLLTGISST